MSPVFLNAGELTVTSQGVVKKENVYDIKEKYISFHVAGSTVTDADASHDTDVTVVSLRVIRPLLLSLRVQHTHNMTTRKPPYLCSLCGNQENWP